MASKSKGEVGVEVTGSSAKLSHELAKASKELKKFGVDLKHVAEITRATFAFEVGKEIFSKLKELTKGFGELAVAGERAADIATNFRELGGTAEVLNKARESTLGVVTATQLMALENKGLIAQGPAFNKFFDDIVVVATHQAKSLGISIPDAVTKLENALIKGNKKGLLPFGISLGNVKKGAETTIKGLAAVAEEASKIPPEVDSAAKAFEALGARLTTAREDFGKGIDSSNDLRLAYRELETAIAKIDWKTLGEQAASAFAAILSAANSTLPTIVTLFQDLSRGIETFLGGTMKSAAVQFRLEIEKLEKELSVANHPTGTNWWFDLFSPNKEAVQKQLDLARSNLATIENAARQSNKETATLNTKNWLDEFNKQSASKATHLKAEETLQEELNAKVAKEKDKLDKQEAKDVLKMQDDLAEAQKKAYQDSVDFWETAFENAITGVTFNLEDALKQVAVGFAAQLAASMTGLSFQGGIKGLGVQLAQMLTGGGGGGTSSLMNTLGMGNSLLAGTQAGGFIEGLGGTVGPVASGAEYGGMLSGSSLAASVAPAMPYIAAAVGTYMVAKHFGVFDHGPKNPESIARQTAQDKINSMSGRNFDFGPTNRFNAGMGGFDQFNSMGAQGKNAFGGLGVALQGLLGITENIGPQIGAILSTDLSGNLDEAKKLTRDLGFGMEEMKSAVIKAGLQMGETWLEIQGKLSGIDDLFTPGLTAVGDFQTAFQNIINSGGEGTGALIDVRDAAIEAGEAGITNFEQWGEELKKTFSDKDVTIFFQALKDMGIGNFDQLKNASDEMAIALVAHLDALQFGFKDLKDNIDKATDSIHKLNEAADTAVDTTSNTGTTVTAHARGGIVNSRTMFGYGGKLGLMGEMGPEAILPLTRVGGKLGVAARLGNQGGSNGITFMIDARGAAPGVEHEIERALSSMRRQIMDDTSKLIQRNQFYSKSTKEWR